MASLDALFITAKTITDDEIQSHFSKYLCVKVSGLLESYIKAQIGDYVDTTSSKATAKYVKKNFKNFTNIDYKKLCGFLESFDEKWKADLELVMEEEIISSLNTIIANRNNIAHGNNDSITMRIIEVHYGNLKLIISFLDDIIRR
ncbi:HEPN domain-containing protein [Flavobacterium sp. DGU11]|uniref:HEPN domain-containing protein n=1 Tax=Flavobacterium arundinis TaxID=3139143 RepID=A0ABU9HRJ4_9FLAO